MAAIEFHHQSPAQLSSGFTPCQNGCRVGAEAERGSTRETGRRVAMYIVTICGYPAGGLCRPCARNWKNYWNQAGGQA